MTTNFGWSLPPGCLALPGESPEEQAAEAMIEALYETIAPLRKFYADPAAAESTEDAVVNALEKIVTAAYTVGRTSGMSDMGHASELNDGP
jgi:hypothetical protein